MDANIAKPDEEPARGELDALLAQVSAAAAAGGCDTPMLGDFVRGCFEMSSPDSLRLRTVQRLAQIATTQWRFAQQRQAGQLLVCAAPPEADSASGLATLMTCVDDMPFLVDSVGIAIRAHGAAIDWLVHPVLKIRRDAEGRIAAVGEGGSESLMYFEFEPLADEADYRQLENELREVIAELSRVVEDFQPMRQRLRALVTALEQVTPEGDAAEFAEAREFLNYLDDQHFTFLGCIDSTAAPGPDGRHRFHPEASSGLGLLRTGASLAGVELIAPQSELDKYADSPRVVVVTKGNVTSRIHRAELIDSISIKRFGANGELAGTVRFIGLFSTEVYIDRPREIPLVRRKASYVMERARLPEQSHSGKHLRDILHALPRDELFQSSEDELYRLCMGIRALRDRNALRLFVRRDRYGRFFSCLVYLPRDRYSHELRARIGSVLGEIYGALSTDSRVEGVQGGLMCMHFIVRTRPGTVAPLEVREVEQRIIAATRSWREQLRALLPADDHALTVMRIVEAFPLSYQEAHAPLDAATDLAVLRQLSPQRPVLPRLSLNSTGGHAEANGLKLFALERPVTLSTVLPMLENFGLDVVSQDATELQPKGGNSLWIQQFELRHPGGTLSPALQRERFEAAFLQVWAGEVDSDRLNRLVLAAGLTARQVSLLRAISKYLIQTGLPFGEGYMTGLLSEHAEIAALLVQLFEARFALAGDPVQRQAAQQAPAQALDQALDQVQSLDADRVLRAYLSVVKACLRTNYFQRDAAGADKAYISFKLDPAQIPELPLPRPKYEIWVCAPNVEGVHLRGGKVARGGLRWSDRRQDFRTEVLGLMKAQMVKNAVIVPVGAKGGFYVKKGPPASERDAWMANGIECYKTFLRGLLDLTDNRVGADIVAPQGVVRYDDDDPYLVVAADKGTATFSDIANGIAADYGFWLGDAFASGGSAGYDHKKMGITARGAWESVKRHFRELVPAADGSGGAKDIQNEPFTAVGIGDMSGDVFGNGMLLSRRMRLLAAFDHRHIFIDPSPDVDASFAERERLFALPRSSWADYDTAKLSPGGGIWPRSAKLIKLSEEARQALAIEPAALTPNALIQAILRAPVDLLWNGGIGTYVKSASQANSDVGDRSNDAVRVNGRELRARVVGEGGNLGFTQLGRIEYALDGGPRTAAGAVGGRINTDAIDNAGGVHTSDREVNIKIPLNQLTAEGRLSREARDPLLAGCTSEIAQFVLRDNYIQSAAISLIEAHAPERLEDHAELIRLLEREGLLNRALEFLPDEDGLNERRQKGTGLVRPELAVLISYAKISLYHAVLESEVPDDPFFVHDLLANFPASLIERYAAEFAAHRLKREIVATMLSNAVVNRMGAGFAHLWAEDHGLTRGEVVKAYATAHRIYAGDGYWHAIEALDNRVPAALQYRLMARAVGLLKHVTGWLTQSRYAARPVQEAVDRFAGPVAELGALLPETLPTSYREDWQRTVDDFVGDGAPHDVAMRIANTRALGAAPDIVELADEAGVPLAEAAAVYYLVGERFDMLWLYAALNDLPSDDKWRALARVNLRDDAYRIHRQLAGRILALPGDTAQAKLDGWTAANERRVRIGTARLSELRGFGSQEFEALAVAVRELRKLRLL